MSENNEHYYAMFDQRSHNGNLFHQDLASIELLPKQKLTELEKNDRTAWIDHRNQLMHHYLSGVVVQEDRSQITSRDIFLQERVVPPPLVVSLNPSKKRPNNELRLERRFPPSQSV